MILTSQKKLNPQLWTNINNFDIYKKIFKNLKNFFIYSRCTFFYREHFFKFKGIEFLLFVSKLIFIFEDFKCFYFEKKNILHPIMIIFPLPSKICSSLSTVYIRTDFKQKSRKLSMHNVSQIVECN